MGFIYFCFVYYTVKSLIHSTLLQTFFHLSFIAAIAYSRAYYGQASGSIHLDNLACTGSEGRLIDCSYDSHTADCTHSEDAGLSCSTCEQVIPLTINDCKSHCENFSFMVSLPAMSLEDRAGRGGGWVHLNGEKSMT